MFYHACSSQSCNWQSCNWYGLQQSQFYFSVVLSYAVKMSSSNSIMSYNAIIGTDSTKVSRSYYMKSSVVQNEAIIGTSLSLSLCLSLSLSLSEGKTWRLTYIIEPRKFTKSTVSFLPQTEFCERKKIQIQFRFQFSLIPSRFVIIVFVLYLALKKRISPKIRIPSCFVWLEKRSF